MSTPQIDALRLVRFDRRPDRTLGDMQIRYSGDPEWHHFAWVVEDTDRMIRADQGLQHIKAAKVKAKTAIPYGRYRLTWTLSPSRGVHTLRLQDVPGFQGILIHSGNTPDHTEGCLCPGLDLDRTKGETRRSKPAVEWLEEHVRAALDAGREVWISIEAE